MWKNIVEPVRPQIIWRTRIVCGLTQATDTHSEFSNMCCFSIATMDALVCLSVALCVQ